MADKGWRYKETSENNKRVYSNIVDQSTTHHFERD